MGGCEGVSMTKKRYPEGHLCGAGMVLYLDSSGGYMNLSTHVKQHRTIHTLHQSHGF